MPKPNKFNVHQLVCDTAYWIKRFADHPDELTAFRGQMARSRNPIIRARGRQALAREQLNPNER